MQNVLMSQECVFCKIIQGHVPAYKVFEDAQTLAFLDINPVTHGHILIVPKEHHEWLLDLPEKTLEELMHTVQRVAKAVMKATPAKGFNVGMNNGRVAGQIVFHAHFHVIPRYDDDKLSHWPRSQADEKSMKEISEKIAALLKQS